MNPRVPPEDEDLTFARNTKSGRVHILCSEQASRFAVPTRNGSMPFAEALAAALTTPCVMLCGTRLLTGGFDNFLAVWTAGHSFADEDLCRACVKAMDDQSWRVFHADNRSDPCADEELRRGEVPS